MEQVCWISAYKDKEESKYLTSCDLEDKEAILFQVMYPGASSAMPLEFKTLMEAQRIANALTVVFYEGQKEKARQVREVLRCDDGHWRK